MVAYQSIFTCNTQPSFRFLGQITLMFYLLSTISTDLYSAASICKAFYATRKLVCQVWRRQKSLSSIAYRGILGSAMPRMDFFPGAFMVSFSWELMGYHAAVHSWKCSHDLDWADKDLSKSFWAFIARVDCSESSYGLNLAHQILGFLRKYEARRCKTLGSACVQGLHTKLCKLNTSDSHSKDVLTPNCMEENLHLWPSGWSAGLLTHFCGVQQALQWIPTYSCRLGGVGNSLCSLRIGSK